MNAHTKAKLWPKILKVILRGYISLTPFNKVSNLTDYFTVPKGEDNVRVVYNGTSSGLNKVLWAPNFWLPTS